MLASSATRFSAERRHWEQAYFRREASQHCWFQSHPATSLALIKSAGLSRLAPIIDVGGGTALLADALLEAGYRNLTVLDIAGAALRQARVRLAARASRIAWLEQDIRDGLGGHQYALWHDRAVFHYLREEEHRRAYLAALYEAVPGGGFVVMATFAPSGPPRCSGLDVVRYSATDLQAVLGENFVLRQSRRERHTTPTGMCQNFLYCLFQRGEEGA